MKYIERFSSLVPAIQGNKIVGRIEKMKENGEIQTEAEYNIALQEILSGLSIAEFKPLFEYLPITPELSSSERFNDMMDIIRDDLDVVFIELNNIFAAMKAHESLFRDKLLDELHFTLKELEDRETALSIIGDIANSFDDVSLNSFNGTNFSLDKSNPFANEVLFDSQRKIAINDESLVFIDSEEQVATLPLSQQEDILFVDASIKTAETTVTEENIQLTDSRIKDVLNPDSASGWAYNILVKKAIKEGSKLSLELDLGDKRRISYLKIHPVSDFPMLLEKIFYVNINNNIIDLPDDSLFGQAIHSPVRISFPDIIAKKIILKLSQSSSVLFDYDENQPLITFDDLRRQKDIKYNISILTDNIKETIQAPDLLDVIPIVPSVPQSFSSFNQYVFAFKSISCGISSYKDKGYFVSGSYKKDQPGLIAIDTEEDIPEVFDEGAAATVKIASFEYDIVKKDYNEAGEIINSTTFPVLPVLSSDIPNERLHFTGNNKVIKLRLIGHKSNDTATDIRIFRNNIELTRGLDWRFFDRANQLDDSDDNIFPNISSTKIEVLHTNDIIRTGIYTASYIPRYIAEPNIVVEENEIIYLPNGTTEHKTKKGIDDIKKSEIFLKASIRNNTRSFNRTPKLKSYKLLTSSIDEDKHVRIK